MDSSHILSYIRSEINIIHLKIVFYFKCYCCLILAYEENFKKSFSIKWTSCNHPETYYNLGKLILTRVPNIYSKSMNSKIQRVNVPDFLAIKLRLIQSYIVSNQNLAHIAQRNEFTFIALSNCSTDRSWPSKRGRETAGLAIIVAAAAFS